MRELLKQQTWLRHFLIPVVALLSASGTAGAAASYCTATYTISTNATASNRIGFYNSSGSGSITPIFSASSTNSNALAQDPTNANLYYIDRANNAVHKLDVNTGIDTIAGTLTPTPQNIIGGTTDASGNYYVYDAVGKFGQVNLTTGAIVGGAYKSYTPPSGYTLVATISGNGDFTIDSTGQAYVIAETTAVPAGSGLANGPFLWKLNLSTGNLTSPVPLRSNGTTQWSGSANGLVVDPTTGTFFISSGTGPTTGAPGVYSLNSTTGVTSSVTSFSGLTDLGGCPVLPNAPTIAKSFSPSSAIGSTGTTTLTITLNNSNLAPIFVQSDFIDTLPTNMKVAATPALGGTCTAVNTNFPANVITATAGAGTVTLTAGSRIPAGGCTITVNVTATGAATYTNTIAANALDTTTGKNAASAFATYTLLAQPTLTLSKTVAAPGRANAADQFTVQINNGATTTASTTTAGSGTTVTSGSTGAVTLTAGTTYTLTEVMAAGSSSPLSYYTSTISCSNSNSGSSTVLPSGAGQSFTVTPSGNDVITCTLTNTRKSATLQLRKTWAANSIAGDKISLPATTGFTNNTAVLSSTATASGNTDSGVAITVYAGDTGTLPTETFTTGSSANYTATLVCTGNATALSGTTLTINSADTAVLCTYTNTRRSFQLTLQKTWAANSIAGNKISIPATTGLLNNTAVLTSTAAAAGNTDLGGSVTVYAGETATLAAESFTVGTSANYSAVLGCVGATPSSTNALSSNTVAVSSANIVCTYTNTRKSATLQLRKTWTANSIAGDKISIPATTGLLNNTAVLTSTATATGNTDNGVAVTVYAGETGTLGAESFTVGSSNNYGAVLSCTGNATALSGTNALSANTLTISGADTAILCTYTNSRAKPNITLMKFQRIVAAAPGTTHAAPDFNFTTTPLTSLPKDVLEYCIVYSNTGGTAPNFKITDSVPSNSTAVLSAYATNTGSYYAANKTTVAGDSAKPTGGINLTNASDSDAGTLTSSTLTLDLGASGVPAGSVATPTVGTVCFQTKIN